MNNFFTKFLLVSSCVFLTSACTPVGVAAGAGASVGLAVVQEGGVKGALSDTAIQFKIADAWIKYDFDMYRKLDLTVKEGRVLITGSVPDPDKRVEAVRLAWQADGVKQVLNEIMVDDGGGLGGVVKDSWITSSIRTKIMLDKNVKSVNYTVDTANGNVYIMGIAQDKKELSRVVDYARNTSNVSNVVNYVRLKVDPVKQHHPVALN